jgi:hypothetical protein
VHGQQGGTVSLTAAQLVMLVGGIDWRMPAWTAGRKRRSRRWGIVAVTASRRIAMCTPRQTVLPRGQVVAEPDVAHAKGRHLDAALAQFIGHPRLAPGGLLVRPSTGSVGDAYDGEYVRAARRV